MISILTKLKDSWETASHMDDSHYKALRHVRKI